MICLVTDRRRFASESKGIDRLVDVVASAARAGVDLIQVRERDLGGAELARLARRCVAAVEGTGSRVLVNDRADVAVASGAHGVHLRADSVEPAAVRRLLPGAAVVGRSVHRADEAADLARAGGVDYLIFGTMFPTESKDAPDRFATLDDLARACRSVVSVPVLAIGGMTVERAALAARAGASGIAGIGLFIPPQAQDPDQYFSLLVAELRRAFDTCGAVP